MSDNITAKDGTGVNRAMATSDIGGVHHPKNILTTPAGDPVSPATQATLAAVLAAMLDVVPATDIVPVTPSDSTALSGIRSLYIGTGGDVVLTVNGNVRTIPNVPDGFILPVKGMTRVRAATTATDIFALI